MLKRSYLVIGLFALSFICLALTLFYGVHYFNRIHHRSRPIPRQTDISTIASWMTISYIARSYHVPEPTLYDAADADPKQDKEKSIESLAKARKQDPKVLLNLIRNRVRDFQDFYGRSS
jgi:hypothetical protein